MLLPPLSLPRHLSSLFSSTSLSGQTLSCRFYQGYLGHDYSFHFLKRKLTLPETEDLSKVIQLVGTRDWTSTPTLSPCFYPLRNVTATQASPERNSEETGETCKEMYTQEKNKRQSPLLHSLSDCVLLTAFSPIC